MLYGAKDGIEDEHGLWLMRFLRVHMTDEEFTRVLEHWGVDQHSLHLGWSTARPNILLTFKDECSYRLGMTLERAMKAIPDDLYHRDKRLRLVNLLEDACGESADTMKVKLIIRLYASGTVDHE